MPTLSFDPTNRTTSRQRHARSLDNQETYKTQILPNDFNALDKWDLRRFLISYGKSKRLRMCGVAGLPCHSWLCPVCSPKDQRKYRAKLRKTLQSSGIVSALSVTLTVANLPERPLAAVWGDLDKLTLHLTSGNWLSSRVDGFVRVTEVTRSENGWHPHTHWNLVFQKELTSAEIAKLRREIITRWTKGAWLRGIAVSETGQFITKLETPTEILKWNTYMTKASTVSAAGDDDAQTPGDILAAAAQGDADALDLWHELETASASRRQRATAGVFRASKAKP